MKKLLRIGAALVMGLALAAPGVYAQEHSAKGKEATVKGTAMCAKCALHKTATCQTVIQVEKGKKKVLYYLADNAVAKDFHKNVCSKNEEVNATGTVKKVGDKLQLAATKIEPVK